MNLYTYKNIDITTDVEGLQTFAVEQEGIYVGSVTPEVTRDLGEICTGGVPIINMIEIPSMGQKFSLL
jgi:hypothetical protein